MPANSNLLGFNCIICGRDYGSVQFIAKQRTRKIKRSEKRVLGRVEPDILQMPKRPELTPLDYSLRNAFITRYEEELLDKASKDLAELRRNGWHLLPFSPPLSESERTKLERYVSQLKSKVEARKLQQQGLERKESLWDVTEEISEIDPLTYELMKKLMMQVAVEKVKTNDGVKDKIGIINNTSNHMTVEWNPITMIRKYRHKGDPLRYLDFPMDFYAKVLAKYGIVPNSFFPKDSIQVLTKAFDIINEYRRQFYDRNYRYTWYEWFWIVRYAQAFTPRRAAKMLLVLDGEGVGTRGIISPKHIKHRINQVMKFWQDYFYFSPYFFCFLKLVHRLIERDLELKAEYNKMLEEDHEDNDITINKMLKEHTKTLQQKLLYDNSTYVNTNKNDYYLGTDNNDFKAVKVRPERIRIHHSNKNYQKEMKEFENGSRKEKPKKKVSCTFSPQLLPMDVRIELHKQGKVPIIEI